MHATRPPPTGSTRHDTGNEQSGKDTTMTDTMENDTTPGTSRETTEPAGSVGARIRELRERAGLTRDQVARMMRDRGYAWLAETVEDTEAGRRPLGLMETIELIDGLAERAFPGDRDPWRRAVDRTILPMVGKAGFPLMLAQARADLDDIARAQDRAIATLEHVRAWLEEEAGDYVVEGVVSSMKGHLGVGKSEIGCDIDTLRMIGDRYDRPKAAGPASRTIARSEGADARDGGKDPARPAPPTADPAHGTPRHAKGDRPAPAPMASETHVLSIPTSPVRYDRLWKERVEPYLRQNGGWRLRADIKTLCEKEAKENGSKPRSVANGIRRAAQRTGGRLRFLKINGNVAVWYLADMDPDDVAARARQDPRSNG